MTTKVRLVLGLLAAGAVVVACGGESLASRDGGSDGFIPNGGGGSGGASDAGNTPCTTAADCSAGFTCDNNVCVPPETETNRSLSSSPPVATPHYVYALNPTAASVARIDPVTLAIEAVPVGPNPVGLAALPGEDAAVVLSYDDASLTVVDSSSLPSRTIHVPLKRQESLLTVSADGAFAVAWPDPTVAPASGSEGVFTLIDLKKARQGLPADQVRVERAGGYRITDVVFRIENGVATKLHVFAKSTVSTFDLSNLQNVLPARLTLPASMSADVSSREVVANSTGQVVMLRSTSAAELASFDGTNITVVTLPETATDLDLLPDGSAAVAALRTSGEVAFIELPGDIADPTGIQTFPVPGVVVGQVALPPVVPSTGMFALIYSTATSDEAFARVDLPSGTVTRYQLEKSVAEIGISPDSKSAVILHSANPNTTATDPYEKAVDQDQGYSVFDVASGYWQLQRTGTTVPTRYAFSPEGGYVGVALRNDQLGKFSLHAVNLSSLVATPLPLASAPLFMGTVPEAPGITPHRVFVSQDHPAGRISVIQLDSGQVRTATGFTLNAEIE